MGKWTRRAFISAGVIAGGGILVGVAIRPGNLNDDVADTVAGEGETLVHAYVKIDQDNVITAIVPHSEMGQGSQTALAQMLADELDADWNLVRVEEAPALAKYSHYAIGRGYLLAGAELPGLIIPSFEGVMMRLSDALDLQVTGGSMSVRVTGTYGMRVAGAATREMLRRAAAKAWGVPLAEIRTENSTLFHDSTARSEPYVSFAEAAAEMTPSYAPKLKDPKDFKVMGQPVQRFDIPAKVDGTAQFALDVRRPNMVYATVRRSPVFGGRIDRIDDSATRAVKGVLDVVRLPVIGYDAFIGEFTADESVAVVAEGYWQASRGLRALDVRWNGNGNEAISSASIRDRQNQELEDAIDRKPDIDTGDTDEAFANADTVISADYRVPYLAHTCMEPLNATADVRDGICEIWIGCQNPLGFKRAVAAALGFKEDDVVLHNLLMGGGFGRKSRADWAIQAALVSRAVGRPVQLIWSREEDVRQDYYRPGLPSRFRAALGTDGSLAAWENTYVGKLEPVEAPVIPYAVPARNIGHVPSESYVPLGAWRSVDESQHGFFTECFIDECAAA
ncbi:MAG: molybdopterin cofactor-binding domain-containing protein, partial [Pseudomonadota bacterium]